MSEIVLENRHTRERLVLRPDIGADGTPIVRVRAHLPPGCETKPMRVHLHQVEDGVVRAGTLGARVGGVVTMVPPGGRVELPAGVEHRWWNAGSIPVDFEGQVVPAGRFIEFTTALFALLNESPNGRPALRPMARLLYAYRDDYQLAVAPRWVPRALLPLLASGGA